MRISAILLLLALPLSADVMTVSIRSTECNHIDITDTKTGETQTIHLDDVKSKEPTENPFILWARDTLAFESVDTKRMTKYTAKATLEGKAFAPTKYSSEPIAEPIAEPISEPIADPAPIETKGVTP